MINTQFGSQITNSVIGPNVRLVVQLFLSVAYMLSTPSTSRADVLAVDWSGNAWIIDECTGEALASTPTGYFQLNSLARDSQGQFFTVGSAAPGDIFDDQILLTVDPLTGLATAVAPLPFDAGIEGTVRSLAFSHDDVLYATVRTPYTNGTARLYRIDVTTGQTTFIGNMGTGYVQAMACSDDGVFYGIDGLGRLGIIDLTTGVIVPVGDSPGIVGLDSLAFGPTGVLWAIEHDLDELYSLNVETGEARLITIGNYGDVRGLEYIPGSSSDPVPPSVACFVATPILSIRNGSLVDVGLQLDVSDDEDPAPAVSIHVYSNEPDADSVVLDEDGLALSAKRDGSGGGRVYLIVVAATDCCGNTAHDCCTVVVPHDDSNAAEMNVVIEAELAELSCDETGTPPDGYVLAGSAELP